MTFRAHMAWLRSLVAKYGAAALIADLRGVR